MRKSRRYLLISLLIAILGFVSWLLLSQPSEPIYQGKPLSFWCEQYTVNRFLSADNVLREQAETSIRAIGTNAVPTLLKMFRAKDSNFKLKLIQLSQKQHLINIKWRTAASRHWEAEWGLYCLGPQAKSAVPALLESYNETKHQSFGAENHWADQNELTTIALIYASIGPVAADAIPQLVQDTTADRPDLRMNAVFALGQIHSNPELTLPALANSLRDPENAVKAVAAYSLGVFGSDAKSVIPELTKILANPDSKIKEAAASALKKIDPEAAAQAGVK